MKLALWVLGLLIVAGGGFSIWAYNTTSLIAIQPIGAVPDGVTLWVHRDGRNLEFFDSPDAMCLRAMGSVNLLCRGMMLGKIAEDKDQIITRLEYREDVYLRSTGGRTFE